MWTLCHGNTVAESFLQTLKRERIRRKTYTTGGDVKREVLEYIELFYNLKRKHTKNGRPAQCRLACPLTMVRWFPAREGQPRRTRYLVLHDASQNDRAAGGTSCRCRSTHHPRLSLHRSWTEWTSLAVNRRHLRRRASGVSRTGPDGLGPLRTDFRSRFGQNSRGRLYVRPISFGGSDEVRIMAGPFANLSASVEAAPERDGVFVLLAVMG